MLVTPRSLSFLMRDSKSYAEMALRPHSSATIDRESLNRVCNIPPALTDRQANLWLADKLGIEDYQTKEGIDVALVRQTMSNAADASIESINQALYVTAQVMAESGNASGAEPEPTASPTAEPSQGVTALSAYLETVETLTLRTSAPWWKRG
jgi:ligand-binding sensor domain-containing protein